jgi:putative methionine-R-sulfoxide reductase with GAF domain
MGALPVLPGGDAWLSTGSLCTALWSCWLLTVSRSEARLGSALRIFPMHGSAQPEENSASTPDTILGEERSSSVVTPKSVVTASSVGASGSSNLIGSIGDRSNGTHGLEESELESTLQLLVERAQYITGATGTALALPQGDEMVCRASAGSSAPAVGARLQVRSGLTGESVSRGQLLRCDNAETDPRVNLEACRALGIASIVVLPLLRRTGEVRGLFELFSDHPYAFEERDLIALERMAALTLTALDLAEERQSVVAPSQAESEKAIEASNAIEASAGSTAPLPTSLGPEPDDDDILSDEAPVAEPPGVRAEIPILAAEAPVVSEPAAVEPIRVESAVFEPTIEPTIMKPTIMKPTIIEPTITGPTIIDPKITEPAAVEPLVAESTSARTEPGVLPAEVVPTESTVHLRSDPEPASLPQLIISSAPVPEAMRRVQKCESCSFPVSEGRTLCLDCEKNNIEKDRDRENDRAKRDLESKRIAKMQSGEPPADTKIKLAEKERSESDAATADLPTADSATADSGIAVAPASSGEFVPAFLTAFPPGEESWLSNHVNLLAIIVLIMGILVAVVVFR